MRSKITYENSDFFENKDCFSATLQFNISENALEVQSGNGEIIKLPYKDMEELRALIIEKYVNPVIEVTAIKYL